MRAAGSLELPNRSTTNTPGESTLPLYRKIIQLPICGIVYEFYTWAGPMGV